MRLVFTCLFAFAAAALWPGQVVAEDARDILIIANKSLSANPLTLDEVRDLFLKKTTQFRSGKNAVVINARSGSLLRRQFVNSAMGMTEAEEATYWQNRKLKTGDTPPPEFSDSLKAVFKLKNGLGYAFRGQMKGNVVNILATIPFVPEPNPAPRRNP